MLEATVVNPTNHHDANAQQESGEVLPPLGSMVAMKPLHLDQPWMRGHQLGIKWL